MIVSSATEMWTQKHKESSCYSMAYNIKPAADTFTEFAQKQTSGAFRQCPKYAPEVHVMSGLHKPKSKGM
jgi:hypothetical protein